MSPALPVQCETVDISTGKVLKTETVPFQIMPPPAGACTVCGRSPAHRPDEPHDAQSLYYQYAFFAEHGRWPTWRDALAHCPDDIKSLWEQALRERGAWPSDEGGQP
jgi:hypothetical protein